MLARILLALGFISFFGGAALILVGVITTDRGFVAMIFVSLVFCVLAILAEYHRMEMRKRPYRRYR